jgi:hypothetical protein
MKKMIKKGMLFVIFLFFLFIVISFITIQSNVKMICRGAVQKYHGDCVEALIKTLDDTRESYRNRNQAVYGLGQLADPRALPVLTSYYNGRVFKKESLENALSQHELKKAINWCTNGNITSWMYRGFK